MKRIAWATIIPQLGVQVVLVTFWWLVLVDRPWPTAVVYGAMTYLIWSLGSKTVVLRFHRNGLELLRAGRYDEAVAQFERSYAFLSRHRWIDENREVVLLDSSAVSYREMALVNAGAAHVHAGRLEEGRQRFLRTIEEFPESEIARSNLVAIDEAARPGV